MNKVFYLNYWIYIKKGSISIYQIPIDLLGQEFTERELSPETIDEIFGDLIEESKEYRLKRESSDKIKNISKKEPDIPLGIYFKITEMGETIIVSLVGDTVF